MLKWASSQVYSCDPVLAPRYASPGFLPHQPRFLRHFVRLFVAHADNVEPSSSSSALVHPATLADFLSSAISTLGSFTVDSHPGLAHTFRFADAASPSAPPLQPHACSQNKASTTSASGPAYVPPHLPRSLANTPSGRRHYHLPPHRTGPHSPHLLVRRPPFRRIAPLPAPPPRRPLPPPQPRSRPRSRCLSSPLLVPRGDAVRYGEQGRHAVCWPDQLGEEPAVARRGV